MTAPVHRALARMGNVYYQQKEWKEAIKYFDKSLTEHRNADVLKKKQMVRCSCVFSASVCVCVRASVRVSVSVCYNTQADTH